MFEEMGYLEFPGIPYQVVCNLFMISRNQFKGQLYAQDHGLIRLKSREINMVVSTLRSQSEEWIENNLAKYKGEASIITERVSNFHKQVLETHTIRSSELLDWQPEKRIQGYKLPDGKNAVLIRDWRVSGEDSIDTSSAEVIPVDWPTKTQKIGKEIAEILGASDTTKLHVDREATIKNSKGLNNLVWNFHYKPQPELYSHRDPWFALPFVGAIFAVKEP